MDLIRTHVLPRQRAFLLRFFSLDVGARFLLTDGTALAAFYLHHRFSRDLELFILDDEALPEVDRRIEHLAAERVMTPRSPAPLHLRSPAPPLPRSPTLHSEPGGI